MFNTLIPVLVIASVVGVGCTAYRRSSHWRSPEFRHINWTLVTLAIGGALAETRIGTNLSELVLYPLTGMRNLDMLFGHLLYAISIYHFLARALRLRGALDKYRPLIAGITAIEMAAMTTIFTEGHLWRNDGLLLHTPGIAANLYWLLMLGGLGTTLMVAVYHLAVVASVMPGDRISEVFYCAAGTFAIAFHAVNLSVRIPPMPAMPPDLATVLFIAINLTASAGAYAHLLRVTRPATVPLAWVTSPRTRVD